MPMASEPLLNVEELLEPIPGDNPAGETVGFTVKTELEEARKEIDPDDYDANDPTRPTEVKRADWAGIVRRAQKVLREESKDLLVAARLTEAMVKQHGFAALPDCLA